LIATRLRYGLGRTDADRLVELLEKFEIRFGGVTPGLVDDAYTPHALALERRLAAGVERFYLMVNAYWEPLTFELPTAPANGSQGWRCLIDTNKPTPLDICDWHDAPAVAATTYQVGPRSIVVLMAEERPGAGA
jgi:isoamylase